MKSFDCRYLKHGVLGAIVAGAVAISLACAAAEPTPTPIPPAPPAPPAAPTAAPAPTATLVPATPTPVRAAPTPTRAIPTPTPVAAAGGPQYGGTLRFAFTLDIDNLDPAHNSLPGALAGPFYALYDQMLTIDPQSNLAPRLAETWSFSADGKTITFNLRKGVKFHDGTPFNGQAVKWNFDRMMDPQELSLRRGELSPYLQRVEVVDENTVRLQLVGPYRPLLLQLASDRMGWLGSPAAVQKYGGGKTGNYGRNPVGTGPFRFAEWVPGSHLRVEKNPNYWEKGKPYLDAILMQGVLDPSVRLAMLRTGEADIIYRVGFRAEDVPIVERQPELRVVRIPGTSTVILQFNASKPPFDNQALRQALSYAIDRKVFVDVVYGGAGEPAHTMVATGWAQNRDLRPISFNPARAKEKLAEAGYPKGISIPIGCPPTGVYTQVCEFAQAMVRNVGINLEIQVVETSTYFAMDDKGYFGRPGFGSSSWAHRVDPHIINAALYHKDGFKNLGTYNNPEINRLIDEAATVYDTAKAKPLYDRIQVLAAEAAVAPALAWIDNFQGMNRRVQGYAVYPTVFEHLEFLWLQR